MNTWNDSKHSLLITDTGYRLRHVSGRTVKSDEHGSLFLVQDDGCIVENGYAYASQTGRIPVELVEVTEQLRVEFEESQARGANEWEERQAARRDRYIALAEKTRRESHETAQRARDMLDMIPFGQPILVGHHSERRHRGLLSKTDKLFSKAFGELHEKTSHYESKAAGVGRAGISSDDPDALYKLLQKLQGCIQSQLIMKACNKAIRKYKTDESRMTALVALGLSEPRASELLAGDFCGRIGFASYALQNNNAEIARLRRRIADIGTAKATAEPQREEYDNFTYSVDPEDNRIMFTFDGKPGEEVRRLLKSNAFKWSPSRSAWVRKVTPNASYAARNVKAQLIELMK